VTRAEEVARLETELLALYADPALDKKPAQLAQRDGAWYSEAAVDLLVSLRGDRRDVQVVNTVNGTMLPYRPPETHLAGRPGRRWHHAGHRHPRRRGRS
jgi:6-phospho-beta-glucosidase